MTTPLPATDGARRLPRYLGYAMATSALVFLGSTMNTTSASTPIQVRASLSSTGALGPAVVGYRVQLTPSGGDLTEPIVRFELPAGHRVYTEQTLPTQFAGLDLPPTVPSQCLAPSRIVPERAGRPAQVVCFLNAVPAGTTLALDLTAAVDPTAPNAPARAVVSGASIDTVVSDTSD